MDLKLEVGSSAKEMSQPVFHAFGPFHLLFDEVELDHDEAWTYLHVDQLANGFAYTPFCDDFGPMNLATIFRFCDAVDSETGKNQERMLALAVSKDIQERTNAVFLAGAYMIMRLDSDLESVKTAFAPLHGRVVPYRDVSPGKPNFDLHVQDCWGGLARAKGLGWVSFHAEGFDLEEYIHFDSPLEADLHEIIPGKLVAMRGPVEIPDEMLWTDVNTKDNPFSHRDFSPAHYVDILRQFDVQVVVRLNEPRYSKDAFTRAGIAVADLFFPDCTVPPMDVVAKFLLIAEKVPGAVAVHCKAGLGRTGTLIGLYLMKHHGFSAREAMGWLRIVRPGSVIGPQQGFLCELEGLMRRHGELHRRPKILSVRPLPQDLGGAADFQPVVRFQTSANDDQRFRIHRHSAGLGVIFTSQDASLGDQPESMDADQGIPRVGQVSQKFLTLQASLSATQPVLEPQGGNPHRRGTIRAFLSCAEFLATGFQRSSTHRRQSLGTEPVLDFSHRQQPTAQAG